MAARGWLSSPRNRGEHLSWWERFYLRELWREEREESGYTFTLSVVLFFEAKRVEINELQFERGGDAQRKGVSELVEVQAGSQRGLLYSGSHREEKEKLRTH